MIFSTNAEKAIFYKEQKIKEAKERRTKCYNEHKTQYNAKRRASRSVAEIRSTVSKATNRVRKHRVQHVDKTVRNREYQREFKERRNNELPTTKYKFKNRMEKCRIFKKIKELVPGSKEKRESVLASFLHKPSQKRPAASPDRLNNSVVQNIQYLISTTKKRRSDDARAAMNIITASVSGENIAESKAKCKLAERLGLRRSRVYSGFKRRITLLTSETACYTETTRKLRNDRINEDIKKRIYDWWISPQNSRPTGNKNDVKRKRTGYKTYISHPIQVLEKTQSEVFSEFRQKHPDVKISQRVFEKIRPYYVQRIRPKDRQTCCCRKHVEARLLFRKSMKYSNEKLGHEYSYEHLSDIVSATMCQKPEHSSFHKIECLERKCKDCGVDTIPLFDEAITHETNETMAWEKYEYIDIPVKGGGIRRKLTLIKKTTSPDIMLNYFKDLIHDFAAHQFRASWQLDQLAALKRCLPHRHCLVIHDFSENYKCIEKEELQSSYFSKPEVTLHVSVLYRHAVAEDNVPDDDSIVTELFFVISPDQSHDQHFVGRVQQEVKEHLTSVGCAVDIMHEFTDGCSAQYKSRHCMGMLSHMYRRLGYTKLVRNYFETSHAKGPQDAAGGMLKRQLDMAVMKGNVIQNAHDVFEYASKNLSTPKSGIYQRRVFKYVETVDRSEKWLFRPIPKNRSIHQISTSASPGQIVVKEQSCYTCDNCIIGSNPCENSQMTGLVRAIDTVRDTSHNTDEDEADDVDLPDLIAAGNLVAVIADDEHLDYYLMQVSLMTI